MKIPIMKTGTQIAISLMTDTHLDHTISVLEKKAAEGITIHGGGRNDPDKYWYDEEILYGTEALDLMSYSDYVLERYHRHNRVTEPTEAK